MPCAVSGQQDYVQYEVQYLKVLPGHSAQFEAKLAEHNQSFHSEGPYTAVVDYIVTGPFSGQFLWIMGPGTFTSLDGRPTGDPHDSDWAEVLAHAEGHSNTYWRRNENLSSPRPDSDATVRPILRSRFFEVADNALFVKTQEQIEEVVARMGLTGRSFYRRQFAHRDGRDWVLVTSYENWAELDEARENFQETFVEVHGLAAWSLYQNERAEALVGTEDEYRQRLPALGGADDQ
jgi:hypothetical protein